MSHKTRIEYIFEHMVGSGPMTTKQVMDVFDWPLTTASSVMSNGKSYGYFIEVGRLPLPDPRKGGKGQTIWGVAPKKLAAYIAAHGEAAKTTPIPQAKFKLATVGGGQDGTMAGRAHPPLPAQRAIALTGTD